MAYSSSDIDQDTFVTAFKWMLGFIVCMAALGCFMFGDSSDVLRSAFTWKKTPPAPRFATEGTFYVLSYISAQTKGGVVGFEPGSEVHLVRALEAKGKLLVTDGHYEAEASPSQLTNNLDVADLVRSQEAGSQQRLAEYVSDQSQQLAQLRQEQDMEHSANVSRYAAAEARGSAVGNYKTRLNDAPQMAHGGAYSGGGSAVVIMQTQQGSPMSYLRNPYEKGSPFK